MDNKIKLHRFDIVIAEITIQSESGHRQNKKRPYVIVGNEFGTLNSPVVIAMPLTHIFKKVNFPLHCVVKSVDETGLSCDSMLLGEQLFTLDKKCEIICKIGSVVNEMERNRINQICYDTMLMGTNFATGGE